MQPYQEASSAIRQGGETPINILKNVGLTAIGGGAANFGSRAMSKIIPAVGSLINKYVPENLSIAGLKKLDPRFGKFIQGALDSGYTYDDVRQFMEDKTKKSQDEIAQQDKKNLIEKHSPELHQFIKESMKKGQSHLEAGALARLPNKKGKDFNAAIEKLTKEHKTTWEEILEAVYGGKKMSNNTSQGPANMEQATQSPMQQAPSQQGQAQQGQAGAGQQALMDILNRINQKIGQ